LATEVRAPRPNLIRCFLALRSLAARYLRLKPRHSSAIFVFHPGVFCQKFGDDAHLLSHVASVPLHSYRSADLPVAEIPVLDREQVMEQIERRGFQVIILGRQTKGVR
jgi:DNA mismatch repair ATPase MutS